MLSRNPGKKHFYDYLFQQISNFPEGKESSQVVTVYGNGALNRAVKNQILCGASKAVIVAHDVDASVLRDLINNEHALESASGIVRDCVKQTNLKKPMTAFDFKEKYLESNKKYNFLDAQIGEEYSSIDPPFLHKLCIDPSNTINHLTRGIVMSCAGACTDYHTDLSASRVYMWIERGRKIWALRLEDERSFDLISQSHAHETAPNSNATDWVSELGHNSFFKLELKPNMLAILPPSCIHAVVTPEPTFAIGGNLITARDLVLHAKYTNMQRDILHQTDLLTCSFPVYIRHLVEQRSDLLIDERTKRFYGWARGVLAIVTAMLTNVSVADQVHQYDCTPEQWMKLDTAYKSLMLHFLMDLEATPTKKTVKYQCRLADIENPSEKCKVAMSPQHRLVAHFINDHKLTRDQLQTNKEKQIFDSLYCKQCNKTFASRPAMKLHLRSRSHK